MDIIRLSVGNKSGLSALPIRAGQLIGVADTKEFYMDVDAATRMKLGYSTDEVDFMLSGKLAAPAYDGVTYGIKDGQWVTIRDGKSAYEFAVEGGYTGTETQFNADLAAVGGLADALLAITGGDGQ